MTHCLCYYIKTISYVVACFRDLVPFGQSCRTLHTGGLCHGLSILEGRCAWGIQGGLLIPIVY